MEDSYNFKLYVGYCDQTVGCENDIYTHRAEATFTVNLIDPCPNNTLSIDPNILTSLTIAYHIYNAPDI